MAWTSSGACSRQPMWKLNSPPWLRSLRNSTALNAYFYICVTDHMLQSRLWQTGVFNGADGTIKPRLSGRKVRTLLRFLVKRTAMKMLEGFAIKLLHKPPRAAKRFNSWHCRQLIRSYGVNKLWRMHVQQTTNVENYYTAMNAKYVKLYGTRSRFLNLCDWSYVTIRITESMLQIFSMDAKWEDLTKTSAQVHCQEDNWKICYLAIVQGPRAAKWFHSWHCGILMRTCGQLISSYGMYKLWRMHMQHATNVETLIHRHECEVCETQRQSMHISTFVWLIIYYNFQVFWSLVQINLSLDAEREESLTNFSGQIMHCQRDDSRIC